LKRLILAATAAILVLSAGALAKPPSRQHQSQYVRDYRAARQKFGARAVGCNLIGRRGSCHRRARDEELVRSDGVLQRLLSPVTARPKPVSLGFYVPTANPQPVYSAPASSAPVASSGPASGGYCGAYQFDQQTWSSVGMSGSPCGASPSQQDAAAQRLYQQRGSQPWPNCGHLIPNWAALRQCENSGSYG
jgi:hypothetical protein